VPEANRRPIRTDGGPKALRNKLRRHRRLRDRAAIETRAQLRKLPLQSIQHRLACGHRLRHERSLIVVEDDFHLGVGLRWLDISSTQSTVCCRLTAFTR
jgi:hypothetical protein